MIRVALYTRVSTTEQAEEGFSLADQLERLRHHAKGQGWQIAGEYVDEGHSGRTIQRPGYQKMMAETAAWDTILVLKMDRVHRNQRNFLTMMDHLRQHGKEFASATESFDTATAMGRFVMDIVQRIAQLESEVIGERVYAGMMQKARSGHAGSMGRPAPYGYEYGKESKFVIVPEEAKYVRWMYEARGKGMPKTVIARTLNEKGVRTKRGNLWSQWSIREILENPAYMGHLRWNGIVEENTHKAIIDETVVS